MRPITQSYLLLGRLFLLALPFILEILLSSLWSPSFPLHALVLILLSLAKVRSSSTLTFSPSHDLVLWTDGSVPSAFSKGGSGGLANCSLCGTEATLSSSAGQVCSRFSAKACVILHALGWSRQHQQVCHFSSYLALVLSCPLPFLLPETHWQIWHELSFLSSCSIRLQWIPGHSFFRATTRLMSWPDGERYSRPLQSLVVSLLLSLVSTLVFSQTGHVLSHRNSPTRRFPRLSPRNLCSLVMLAVFSLVYAATGTAYC